MADKYKGLYQMPEPFIRRMWPNLTALNYKLTSPPTPAYNCVSWALGIDDEPIDLSLDEEGEPLVYPDLSCLTYIEYFEKHGFELCENADYESGFEKIALYEQNETNFEHVARQIDDGLWTSKLGEWEDIEHTSLEAVEFTAYYGLPKWFMRRPID